MSTQLDRIEELLKVTNQKMNFLIGGVLGVPFKDPLDMDIEEIKKVTNELVLETEEIEENIEAEHEAHVKSIYTLSMASDIVKKILDNEDLTEDDELFIFDHYAEMKNVLIFENEDVVMVLEKKFMEVVDNVKS